MASPKRMKHRRTARATASSPSIRRRMQSTPRRDTPCEVALRSEVHRLGLRYRVDWPLPGTRRRADIAFPRAKVAVFVDGCFWHCCPIHATWPRANARWWKDKLAQNVARDRDTDRWLRESGWIVLRYWEHADMSRAARRIADSVMRRRPNMSGQRQ
jgi:DNA mismatch endonuclease (patch repair protein)